MRAGRKFTFMDSDLPAKVWLGGSESHTIEALTWTLFGPLKEHLVGHQLK